MDAGGSEPKSRRMALPTIPIEAAQNDPLGKVRLRSVRHLLAWRIFSCFTP